MNTSRATPASFAKKWRPEWIVLSALLGIAAIAAAALIFLKIRHDFQTRVAATATVLEDGEALLDVICADNAVVAKNLSPQDWKALSDRIDSIFAVRKDVQSVSISRDGVTLFNQQADRLLGTADSQAKPLAGETELSRRTLEIGGRTRPVFVLSRTADLPGGGTVTIEAAVRREAVNSAEKTARRITRSLFAFSLAILGGSILACASVLVLAVIRERRREALARQEEHLAFSGVLANGILHDFRNPMSAIQLDAQMLSREFRRDEGFRPDRVSDLSERIVRTTERMNKIFREFLYLAKPADEQTENIVAATAIRECLDTLGPRLEQSGLTAEFNAPENPIVMRGFSATFHRALMNVLVNATQFAPRGSAVRVTLATEASDAIIEVHDDGPGIPPARREKIFEMFATTRPEGTGLGLFLARTAIERAGGTIRVADVPHGTTFRITMPLAKAGDDSSSAV